jgi:hypothetical protein
MSYSDTEEFGPGDHAPDGDTGPIEARRDHDITTAMQTLHDNGVAAYEYAEFLAARHNEELTCDNEEPF